MRIVIQPSALSERQRCKVSGKPQYRGSTSVYQLGNARRLSVAPVSIPDGTGVMLKFAELLPGQFLPRRKVSNLNSAQLPPHFHLTAT